MPFWLINVLLILGGGGISFASFKYLTYKNGGVPPEEFTGYQIPLMFVGAIVGPVLVAGGLLGLFGYFIFPILFFGMGLALVFNSLFVKAKDGYHRRKPSYKKELILGAVLTIVAPIIAFLVHISSLAQI